MRRRRKSLTAMRLGAGQMRFKRRMDLPLWHHEHLPKIARILQDAGRRLEDISNSNSLRNADKTLAAQTVIKYASYDAARITPLDPRERGSERLEWTDAGLVNTNGFDELNARDDLD